MVWIKARKIWRCTGYKPYQYSVPNSPIGIKVAVWISRSGVPA